MSEQTKKMPPVPHEFNVTDVDISNKVTHNWGRWFLQVKYKLDVITANVANLQNLTDAGIAVHTADGDWEARSIVGTSGNVSVTDGNGIGGDPTVDLVATGVTSGTYTNPTVNIDTFGRITTASNGGSTSSGINNQTGTSYTIVSSDAGKDVRCTNASSVTLTVPVSSVASFSAGSWVLFSQGGAGIVTATAATGVTLQAANGVATTAIYDIRGLEYLGSDTWRVI